jgi:hypothetical protein
MHFFGLNSWILTFMVVNSVPQGITLPIPINSPSVSLLAAVYQFGEDSGYSFERIAKAIKEYPGLIDDLGLENRGESTWFLPIDIPFQIRDLEVFKSSQDLLLFHSLAGKVSEPDVSTKFTVYTTAKNTEFKLGRDQNGKTIIKSAMDTTALILGNIDLSTLSIYFISNVILPPVRIDVEAVVHRWSMFLGLWEPLLIAVSNLTQFTL